MRTSERARERAATLLRRRWEEGYMSVETLERRLGATFAATDEAELKRVSSDLPALGLVGRLRQRRERGTVLREPAIPVPLALVTAEGVTLGRSRGSDVVLRDGTVSRAHAELTRMDGACWVRDLGSTNGTWLAGHRVTAPEPVRRGDVLRLGSWAFGLSLV
jgi:hypothetical protein